MLCCFSDQLGLQSDSFGVMVRPSFLEGRFCHEQAAHEVQVHAALQVARVLSELGLLGGDQLSACCIKLYLCQCFQAYQVLML